MACGTVSPAVKAPWTGAPVLPLIGRHTYSISRLQCSPQLGFGQAGGQRRGLASAPCLRRLPASRGLLQPRSSPDFCLSDDYGQFESATSPHASSPADQQQQPRQPCVSSPDPEVRRAQQAPGALQLQHSGDQLQQRQRAPAWARLSAANVRTAVYVVLGSLVAWRYGTVQLRAAGCGFASLSLGGTFHSASQTGLSGAARSAVAGFIAGLLHTLAGADHLAALTPLTIGRSSAKASLLGALWGFGHSTGQLILGLLMVVLKDRFEAFVPALSRWGGTTVGLSLIAIGGMGLLELWQEHREQQQLEPALEGVSGASTGSIDVSRLSIDKDLEDQGRLGLGLYANGILFGLQPDALFVIIPALTLPTQLAAFSYISMFVVGTVSAMGGYTAVIGATSKAIQERNPWLTTNLSVLASCVAIVIGALVLLS